MQRAGSEKAEELGTLSSAGLALVAGLSDVGRLGLAAQLAHGHVPGRGVGREADPI